MDIAFKLNRTYTQVPPPSSPKLFFSSSLINNSSFPKLLSGNTVAFILSSSGIIGNRMGNNEKYPISHIEAESIKFYKSKAKTSCLKSCFLFPAYGVSWARTPRSRGEVRKRQAPAVPESEGETECQTQQEDGRATAQTGCREHQGNDRTEERSGWNQTEKSKLVEHPADDVSLQYWNNDRW